MAHSVKGTTLSFSASRLGLSWTMCAPGRPDASWLAGCGKQVVLTMQTVTSGALLSAHLHLLHRYSYPYVFKIGFYRKQEKLMGEA